MSFFDETVLTAEKFIKTICFIDDQPVFNKNEDPVNEETDHNLYADVVTKAFAPKGKACCFYQYKNANEEADILELANSSDVNVIDWRIIIPEGSNVKAIDVKTDLDKPKSDEKASPIISNSSQESNEKDVEEKESRGKYALRLIEKIIQNKFSSPKLIIILTAEYDLSGIYNPIREKLVELNITYNTNEDELWFQNDKFRISIYFKESLGAKHLSEEVRNKIIAFKELPVVINFEYAKLINGLVLKTAIDCIGEVRANTLLLLGSYNTNLDAAYLSHKALLPNTSDAEDHLIEIIGSDIKGILKGSGIAEGLRQKSLPEYLNEKFQAANYPLEIPDADKMPTLNIQQTITREVLLSIVKNGIEKTFFGGKEQSLDEQILFTRNCHKELTKTFSPENNSGLAKDSDLRFALLTTIKPAYLSNIPLLTQGTIVKEDTSDNYWLCLQPKCDSVRIEPQKKRQFFFLRLWPATEKHFQIVLDKNGPLYLKISYKIYNTKTFEFKSDANGNIVSVDNNGKKKFKRTDGQYLQWVAELKNDYAQSIANDFSTEMSRVGLDLSEWLRRCS
jgi:hypothetical protein